MSILLFSNSPFQAVTPLTHTHTHTHTQSGHALQQGLVHRARLHTCLQSSLHADFEVKYNREAPHSSKLTHSPT